MPQIINILTPTHPTKSTDQNAAEITNLYLNSDNNAGKYPVVAYPTPGTSTPFATIISPVRALWEEHNILYAIGGNTLYNISSVGVLSTLGTLNTSTGYVKIRGINGALMILDSMNGYTYNIATGTLTNLQTFSNIGSVTVTNAGSSYNTATVVITDPTGSGATATATVVAGKITAIAVGAAGTNYSNPSVTITPGGIGATATANLLTNHGTINNITLTNGGVRYVTPIVNIHGTTGSGATATAALVANSGKITGASGVNNVFIANIGNAVVQQAYFYVQDNTGSGAVITGAGWRLVVTSPTNYALYVDLAGIVVSSAGSHYTNPIYHLYIKYSGANHDYALNSYCTLSMPVNSGIIQSLSLTNAGTNYTTPTVTITDSASGSTASGAVATATAISGAIQSYTVTAPGTGYTNSPTYPYTITITDSTGTGATGTVNISGGIVSTITLGSGGTNYTNPTVVINSPGINGAALANLATNSFPQSVIDCECQDEIGTVISANTQSFHTSNTGDLTTWPALNVATITGNQNTPVAIISLRRELYFLGNATTEVWNNAGTYPMTFARRNDVYIEYGCVAAPTVTKNEDSIIFLGQRLSGGIVVLQVNNYDPLVISDDINYQLSTYTTISDAFAFMYQQEGEEFYVLTFPTQGITWVYSLMTKKWHVRQSLISAAQSRWFPSCNAFCYNKQLVGDSQSGNIYQLSTSTYQENGSAITRTLVTHPYYQTGQAVTCDRLQIDFDQTPGIDLAQVNLYVSRDGGVTFGAAKPAFPVQDSNGEWRCYWPRLGRGRSWVFKIQTTLNNKFIILGAWANFRVEGTANAASNVNS